MRFDFMGKRKTWLTISAIVVALAVILLVARGLNLSIDFTGGSVVNLVLKEPVTTAEVREALKPLGLEDSKVQVTRTEDGRHGVVIRTPTLSSEKGEHIIRDLREALGDFELVQFEEIEGIISKELIRNALMALAIASAGMVLYITYRFEFKFAVTGIIALFHDALVTMGVFAALGLEVSGAFVAAILTIIGYSINDTIVVYDRIRENIKTRKKESYAEVVNRSINETLARSINTALTTFLAVSAVYVFGGSTTREFALALMIGIASGTYSSIFVASPLWVMWKEWERYGRRKPAKPATTAPRAAVRTGKPASAPTAARKAR